MTKTKINTGAAVENHRQTERKKERSGKCITEMD